MTTNNCKFSEIWYDREQPALRRRVYAAIKKPFADLWTFITWAGSAWALALPLAMGVALALNVWVAYSDGVVDMMAILGKSLYLGGVWTLYLGAFFLLIRVIDAARR